MPKLVNLRTARKQRARDRARRDATSAAARSGEARHDAAARSLETERARRHLDGHRRDDEVAESPRDPEGRDER